MERKRSSSWLVCSTALVLVTQLNGSCFAHGGGGGGHGGGHGGHWVMVGTVTTSSSIDLGYYLFGIPTTYTGWPPHPVIPQRPAPLAAAPRIERFNDLNLAVTLPGGPWVELDPKKAGSHACVLIVRHDPTIYISLAGERAGADDDGTTKSLIATSQAKIKNLPESAIAAGERGLFAHSFEGISYEASAVEGGRKVHYSMWVAARNGYNYRLAVYGEQKDESAIDDTMLSFLRGIKQIEPNRMAHNDASIRKAEAKTSEVDGVRQIKFAQSR